MNKFEVSVVIASRNRKESLNRLLNDLSTQDYPREKMEVIVVDDCSEEAYKLNEKIILIRNVSRKGGPASRNIAIAKASSEFTLLLDDDMEIVSSNLLKESIKILKSDSKVGMVIFKKIDETLVNDRTVRRELSCSSPSFYSKELKFVKVKRGYTAFGANAFLAYTELLKKLEGFDPVFGKNMGHSFREESDLQVRLRKLGYKLYFEPSLVVIHHILPSGGHGQDTAKFLFWMAHNHIVFLKRNFKYWRLFSAGYIFDVVYYSLCWGRFRYLIDAFRGYREGFKTVKEYEHKQK